MSIYGDYAAQIIQGQRAKDLQAQARRDAAARNGRQKSDRIDQRARGARSGKAGRARVA